MTHLLLLVVVGGDFPSTPDNGPLYFYAPFGNSQHSLPTPSFFRSYDKRSPKQERKTEEAKQEEQEIMRPPMSPGTVEVPVMTAPIGIPAICICYPSVSQIPRDVMEKMGRNLSPSKRFTEDTQTANLVEKRDKNYLSEGLPEELNRNIPPLKFVGEMEMSPEKWGRELLPEDLAAERKRMIMQPEQDNSWLKEMAGRRKLNALSPDGLVGHIAPPPSPQHRQQDAPSLEPPYSDSEYDSYDGESDYDVGVADEANHYNNGLLQGDTHTLNPRSSKTYDHTQPTHNLNTIYTHKSYRDDDDEGGDVSEERMIAFPHRRLQLGLLRERDMLAPPRD